MKIDTSNMTITEIKMVKSFVDYCGEIYPLRVNHEKLKEENKKLKKENKELKERIDGLVYELKKCQYGDFYYD